MGKKLLWIKGMQDKLQKILKAQVGKYISNANVD